MIKLRAFLGALVCVTLSMLFAGATYAGTATYTINAGSSQSNVDNACVGAIPVATGEDCTYNQSDPADQSTVIWIGPVWGAGYYRPGDSPFEKNPFGLPQPPKPDPDNASLIITGSLVIEDINDATCDGDDTVSGRFELEAGTRAFAGAPGQWAEETWGDDTIVFVLPDSLPDSQMVNGDGDCEYIFGSQGFPPFLQTQGQSAAGVLTYPADTEIGSDPINPNPPDNEDDAWDTATVTNVGIGSFEGPGPNFEGNTGVEVSIDQAALLAGSFSCFSNVGGANNPVVTDGCTFKPQATGTPCAEDQPNYCGLRAIQENWIIKITVDASGELIKESYIFANNESRVFTADPPEPRDNSWDGPVLTFTATCDTCSVAKADSYTFVTGTDDVVSLPIGANDDPGEDLDDSNTALTIDAPGPSNGVCTIQGSPGDVVDIECDYDSNDAFASAGVDTFSYTLDDGIAGPELGLQATVTVTVEADDPPSANPYSIDDLDTQALPLTR